jgi:hypothetical protein
MQRLGAWIEPVLVAEWARMMRNYAEGMGLVISPGVAEAALQWLEPDRDTELARRVRRHISEIDYRRTRRNPLPGEARRLFWRHSIACAVEPPTH